MTAASLGFLFVDVDVTRLVHAPEVEAELLALHANGALDAHEPACVVATLAHAGEVEEHAIEGDGEVPAALFHD